MARCCWRWASSKATSGSKRMDTSLSVVVISRNEGRELERTVENFDDTLPAGAEIIVIDDRSTDCSADRVTPRRRRISVHRVANHSVARAQHLRSRQDPGACVLDAGGQLLL